jgi:hypothetical protein
MSAAGSTAKGGILGRRKRVLPEPSCHVTMWRKTANGRFEQVRCLLSEARKSVAAATLAERGNGAVKSRRNAGVLRVQKSPRCRYCGATSENAQICPRCEQIRERHEAAAEGWIGDDTLYLRVQRTLANRERTAAAERLAKHGPGRLERDGPAVKVSEAVDKARRAARASFRQRRGRRPRSAAPRRVRRGCGMTEQTTSPEPPEPATAPAEFTDAGYARVPMDRGRGDVFALGNVLLRAPGAAGRLVARAASEGRLDLLPEAEAWTARAPGTGQLCAERQPRPGHTLTR